MTRQCYVEGMTALLESHGIEHFTAKELCPAGKVRRGVVLQEPPAELWPNIIPTLKIADAARNHFGKPYHVNSAYRSASYNRAVGSTSRRHVEFYALDGWIEGTDTWELYEWLMAHPQADIMGLGWYPTFVHMDTMGVKSRWGSNSDPNQLSLYDG